MASAVQITITVDAGQSAAAIDRLGKEMDTLGVRGEVGVAKVNAGLKTVGGHAATGLDSVRLLSQEFGLRLPRAIEAMISRMPGVTSALSSVLGGMAAIAAAQVFVHVAEEVYQAYEKYVSLNAEADKFYETLKKTSQENFGDTRSLETSKMRGGMAEDQYKYKDKMARQLRDQSLYENPLDGVADFYLAHEQAHEANVAKEQMFKLTKQNTDQTHEQALRQIELNHAMDATLGKAAQINAEAAKQRSMNAENRAYNRKTEMDLGNPSPANAGAAEERIKNQTADAEAAAKSTALFRSERDQRIAIQNEALNAGLEGEKRLNAERMQAIDAVTRKFLDGEISKQTAVAESIALGQKYDNQIEMQANHQIRASEEALRVAKLAGLTGAARIQGEQGNENAKITADTTMDGRAKSNLREAAAVAANQKMTELENNFTDHVKALQDARVEASASGFAKIDAATRREFDSLKKLYDQDFANAALTDAQKLQADTNYQAARAAIADAAGQQRAELAARNQANDLQADQEAARAEARVKEDGALGWVASYRNGIAEIQAAEAERIAKLQEDAAKEGLAGEEVARRKADIDRTANAQIAQQNQQLQHTIAGNLQAAFTDPVQFIKSRMEQMFFEIVAAWIMRMQVFKQLFGSTMGGLTPGGTGGAASPGGAGGILGAVGQAVHGVAAPGAPASSNPIAGMSGTRGYVNGSPDLGKIYGNIPGGGTNTFPGNPTLPGGGSASIPGVNAPYDGPDGTDSGLSATIPSIPAPSGSGFPGSGGASSGAGGLGGLAAAGFGGYTAYQSTVKAFDSGNPLTGALGDAGAGATIGMMFGPEGALIGGAAGALVGLAAGTLGWATGEGGNIAARTWYAQNTRQQLEADEQQQGGGDFQSQISSANKTAADGLEYMRVHFGKSSADWVWSNYMQAELKKVTAEIAATATGGRFAAVSSAAQFHTGGDITGFGSYATSPTEGWIHAMMGETVMNTQAVGAHGPMLRAMNAGASATDIASAYLAGSGGGRSGGGATYNAGDLHVHTLDTKTMSGWLKGGGAQLIDRHLNDYAGQYAGDGVSG